MPNLTIPLRDLHYSVERPVILSIVRQLMDITQISHQTPIHFPGVEAKGLQQTASLEQAPLQANRWPYDEKILIEVEEDYLPERLLTMPVQQPEHAFIFRDPKLGIFIKPVYSTTKVSLNFKYKARDKNQAQMWRNEMRTRTAMLRDLNLHEVDYHYHFQEEYFALLQELHRLRETVAGYGEDFNDYFTQHLTSRARLITNLSGQAGIWGVAERQIRIQGYYDFEGAPEKGEREDEHDNWQIGFNYQFTYEKPIALNAAYPLMVHNQLLDEAYRPTEAIYRLEDQPTQYSVSSYAFAHFESDQRSLKAKAYEGLTIPAFDEFIPANVLPSTVKVLTALVSISPENRRTLFNLKDLGEFQFQPELLQFLSESEYPYLGRDFRSICMLSLYRDNQLQESGSLVVNTNLDVMASKDLDLRQCYHVRFSLVSDYSFLPIAALKRLHRYPAVGQRIVDALNAALSGLGSQPDIGRNRLPAEEVQLLLGQRPADYRRHSQMHLVQTLFVATRPMAFYATDRAERDYAQTR